MQSIVIRVLLYDGHVRNLQPRVNAVLRAACFVIQIACVHNKNFFILKKQISNANKSKAQDEHQQCAVRHHRPYQSHVKTVPVDSFQQIAAVSSLITPALCPVTHPQIAGLKFQCCLLHTLHMCVII